MQPYPYRFRVASKPWKSRRAEKKKVFNNIRPTEPIKNQENKYEYRKRTYTSRQLELIFGNRISNPRKTDVIALLNKANTISDEEVIQIIGERYSTLIFGENHDNYLSREEALRSIIEKLNFDFSDLLE